MVVSAGPRETLQRFDFTEKRLALDSANPVQSKGLFLEV
jgi:hypothetical protein